MKTNKKTNKKKPQQEEKQLVQLANQCPEYVISEMSARIKMYLLGTYCFYDVLKLPLPYGQITCINSSTSKHRYIVVYQFQDVV